MNGSVDPTVVHPSRESAFTSPSLWWWIWIFEIFVGGICVWAVTYLQIGDLRDLRAYIEAAKRVSGGSDLYVPPDVTGALPYVYPPPLALLLQPIAFSELKSIAYVWNALGYAAVVAGCWFMTNAVTSTWSASRLASMVSHVGVLFGVLVFPPTWLGWRLGQVHCFVLFFFSLSLYLAVQRRWARFGALLAAAGWIRVTPAALLFSCKNLSDFRKSLFGFVGVSLCVMAALACVGRVGEVVEYFVGPTVRSALGSLALETNNIALSYFYPFVVLKVFLLIAVGAMFLQRPANEPSRNATLCCDYCLLIVLIHVAAPILWIYHLVSFAPVFAVALIPTLSSNRPRRFLGSYILLFLCSLVMGGDMDYWRVHSQSVSASTVMLVLQNVFVAACAIPVWRVKMGKMT